MSQVTLVGIALQVSLARPLSCSYLEYVLGFFLRGLAFIGRFAIFRFIIFTRLFSFFLSFISGFLYRFGRMCRFDWSLRLEDYRLHRVGLKVLLRLHENLLGMGLRVKVRLRGLHIDGLWMGVKASNIRLRHYIVGLLWKGNEGGLVYRKGWNEGHGLILRHRKGNFLF